MVELNPGEEIVYKAKIHRFCYVFPAILLSLGLLLDFPPDFQPDTHSRYYEFAQKAAAVRDAIKAYVPPNVWDFYMTFQLMRTNYVSLLLITLGCIRLVHAFFNRNFSSNWVTSERVIAQGSVFQSDSHEIPLDRLAHVRIYYGSIGKLLRRGKVIVSDTGMREIELKNLSKPELYRRAILTALKQRREKLHKA